MDSRKACGSKESCISAKTLVSEQQNSTKFNGKNASKSQDKSSELPEDFYPKLRRYLNDTKKEATQLEKMQEYEKSKQLACDIVNSRLRKIIALSSGPTQTEQITKRMATEERLIYDQLGKLITNWRTRILQCETTGEP